MTRRIAIVGAALSTIMVTVTLFSLYKKYSTIDIAGEWDLVFSIEESSYKAYIDETHTQKIYFIQVENEIKGNGEKWKYNGKLLSYDKHRKLEYDGIIKGNLFKAKYILHGRDRITEGIIEAELSDDGNSMQGFFSGTAANSSGSVKGEKVNK